MKVPYQNLTILLLTVKSEAFIHAKGILVCGSSEKKEMGQGAPLQNGELMKIRSLLEISP